MTSRVSRSVEGPRQIRSRRLTSAVETKNNEKQKIVDGTIRYVQSRHGLEVQHYSSKNWLRVDVFTNDACQAQEKPFREMLEKKQKYEQLSRSIYSTDYYKNRWNEFMKSYQSDPINQLEWAKQNYQALCLRTLYSRASQREQNTRLDYAERLRDARAQSAFKQWKKEKAKERLERQRSDLVTSQSERRTDGIFSLTNPSFCIPMTNSVEELATTAADNSYRLSFSTNEDNDLPATSVYQPSILGKHGSIEKTELYVSDLERWSIQSMLKRIVGLAQPLPSPPKYSVRKQSPNTNTSNDSGFESL